MRILQQKAGKLQYFHPWPRSILRYCTIEQIYNGCRARYMRRIAPPLPYACWTASVGHAGTPLLPLAGWRGSQLADVAKGGQGVGEVGGPRHPALRSLGERPCPLRWRRAGAALICLHFKADNAALSAMVPGIDGLPCNESGALACPPRAPHGGVRRRRPEPSETGALACPPRAPKSTRSHPVLAVRPLGRTQRNMPTGRTWPARPSCPYSCASSTSGCGPLSPITFA